MNDLNAFLATEVMNWEKFEGNWYKKPHHEQKYNACSGHLWLPTEDIYQAMWRY